MAPHQHLSPRAQITVEGWVDILTIVSVVVCILFCTGAVLVICKRKRARKHRQRILLEEQESRPFVAQEHSAQEYRVPADQRGDMGFGTGGPIELQGGVVGDLAGRQPQQIDGYVAPAMAGYDGKPVEMPAQTATR